MDKKQVQKAFEEGRSLWWCDYFTTNDDGDTWHEVKVIQQGEGIKRAWRIERVDGKSNIGRPLGHWVRSSSLWPKPLRFVVKEVVA